MENINLNIPKEKFRFADPNRKTGDKKFDTKQMSYAKDVFRRFCKNKSSVIAAIIICLLVAFAILVPIVAKTTYSESLTDIKNMQYVKLLPKNPLFEGTGFWDGTKKEIINQNRYNIIGALEKETGETVITKVIKDAYQETSTVANKEIITTKYEVRIDSYVNKGMAYLSLTAEEFENLQRWQVENNKQVIFPWVESENNNGKHMIAQAKRTDANVWYKTDSQGNPDLSSGDYVPCYASTNHILYKTALYTSKYYNYDSLRIEGDDGSLIYAMVSPTWAGADKTGEPTAISYQVRVLLDNYFEYRYGHEPSFLFGTDDKGQDILTRLASGARFSLILAICVSAINLFIGAIYGAIEGFYGGVADLVMERISDVLGGMPGMVVMSLFQLHLASKVGPVWSMVFAFVLTGWLGMAARTRMQFYRFKRQEYVLSARTLGASDARLMFKHIFPNAMGTLITGSILMIPGVIFSESSLTYLGIVNLEGSTTTSVGTLLSNGSGMLATFPHVIFWPALFISLLEISFNLFGNGLRDAFNPSLKGVED